MLLRSLGKEIGDTKKITQEKKEEDAANYFYVANHQAAYIRPKAQLLNKVYVFLYPVQSVSRQM